MRYILLMIFCSMAFLQALAGQNEKNEKQPVLLPDYVQLQFAGGKGLLSAWAGYHLGKNNKLDFAIGYGYAPAALTQRDVHKLLLQLNHAIYIWNSRIGSWQAFAGLGGSFKLNRNEMMFVRLPEQFPSGYYAPNAIRAHIDLGIRHQLKLENATFQSVDFYVAASSNDIYIYNYFKSGEFGFNQLFHAGIGARIYLR